MSTEMFENQLRGYNAVLGALKALTEDICSDCIMLEGAQTRLGKQLEKLTRDIAESPLSEEEKGGLVERASFFSKTAEGLSQAPEYT